MDYISREYLSEILIKLQGQIESREFDLETTKHKVEILRESVEVFKDFECGKELESRFSLIEFGLLLYVDDVRRRGSCVSLSFFTLSQYICWLLYYNALGFHCWISDSA